MSLAPGTRLGPYEVTALIGQGGMGQVYRATDTKLRRQVAIKVLPESLAADPDRIARLQREARTLAALNHPGIAAIYGLEESDGFRALVMELVEGPTLADRVARGAIPMDEALPIARQIAEALEAAHEQGIIHRDLKPANISVRPDGTVKVLDFGLAKALADDEGGGERAQAHRIANSPTVTSPTTPDASPTLPGVILGTAAYMSPEQARGKTVDRRSDIWALGCVLYEMLTGTRAFPGESAIEILGAIHHKEPDWSALPAETPANVRVIVRRCLAKEVRRRFHSAADVALDLDEAHAGPAAPSSPAAIRSPVWTRWLPWGVAGVMACAAVVLAAQLFRSSSAPRANAIRFNIPIRPAEQSLAPIMAVSPDGTRVAYLGVDAGGLNQVLVRALDSPEARPLAGTEGAGSVFWSPDSRFLGFVADGRLKKIPVSGGAVQTLANTAVPRGASWGTHGDILFTPANAGGLARVSDAGGATAPVTAVDTERGERNNRWPHFLPDGRHFLYLVTSSQSENSGVYVGSLDSSEKRQLLRTRWRAEYAAPGYLLFAQEDRLMTQSFDAGTLELGGKPALVAEGLGFSPQGTGYASFSVSDLGILAYWGGGEVSNRLIWFDREGNQLGVVGSPGAYTNPRLSPDGNRVAVETATEGNLDIWLLDLARDVPTRFTSGASAERFPLWSPDGTRLIFHSNRDTGVYDLYEKPSSGSGAEALLFASGIRKYPLDWSPDGQSVAFSTFGVGKNANNDLWVLPLVGDRQPFPYVTTEFHETQGRFSPDGQWMAYVSDESGRGEVYISRFPESRGTIRVSTDGGEQPQWRRDGQELYYLAPDRALMAVSLTPGQSLDVGTPEKRFIVSTLANEGTYRNPAPNFDYDVTADGQRFLFIAPPGDSIVPITVVLNWFEELTQKGPTP